MKKLILISILLIVGCEEKNEIEEVYLFQEYPDFVTINQMDEYGNPIGIMGEGIWGGCIVDDSLFIDLKDTTSNYWGCMNENACNYNKDASLEDGCVYANENYDCDGNCLGELDGCGNCVLDEILDCLLGDVNSDGGHNVLDILLAANCLLSASCSDINIYDVNQDGDFDISDTYLIMVMAQYYYNPQEPNLPGRGASVVSSLLTDDQLILNANGFIGIVQIMLTHGADFNIELTDRALYADYLTHGNETRLIVILPERDELFSYSGDFEIAEIIVANTQYKLSGFLPTVIKSKLIGGYPNPFNDNTYFQLIVPVSTIVEFFIINDDYKKVTTLQNGNLEAGSYNFTWNATEFSDGYYRAIADFGNKQCFVNLHKLD